MLQQLAKFQTKKTYYPTFPAQSYNKYQSQPINRLVQSYHNESWIQLQDNIQFGDHQQYLKRYYRNSEFRNKIKLLGDYYRFHVQMPRMFMQDIARIIEVNVQEKRQLEYALVTKQMKANQQQDQFQEQGPLESHRSNHRKIINDQDKIIKDVQLSYEDFQVRPVKKQFKAYNYQDMQLEQELQHQRIIIPKKQPIRNDIVTKNQKTNNNKTMKRVDSIKSKGSFLVFKPKYEQTRKNNEQIQNKQKLLNKQRQQKSEINKNPIEPKYRHPKQQSKLKNKNKSKNRLKNINNFLNQNGSNKEQKTTKSNSNNSHTFTNVNCSSNISGQKKHSKAFSYNNLQPQSNYTTNNGQGLSRSKSRTQLHTFNSNNQSHNQNNLSNINKKFETNKQQQLSEKVKKQKSHACSLQNSVNKSLSRKNILGEKKNCMSNMGIIRKGSKIDLKSQDKEKNVINLNLNDHKMEHNFISGCPNIQKMYEQQNENVRHQISRKTSKSKIQGNLTKKMFNKVIQIKKKR